MRNDGRNNDELRLVNITRNYLIHPAGSVLIEMGDTKVIVTATIEERVPRWRHRSGLGWLTGEYSMLPGSTQGRKTRDSQRPSPDGRNVEISRLLGRVLRTTIDLSLIGERTIWIDADVIQADGGTRCAAITGGYVALVEAVHKMYKDGLIDTWPIKKSIAAVSVGKVEGEVLLDLNYLEDSRADVDSNIIMTDDEEFIELQASAEEGTFSREELDQALDYATIGIKNLIIDQTRVLADILEDLETRDKKLVIASHNKGKIKEIKSILKHFDWEVLSQADVDIEDIDVEETGETLEENALIKARAIKEILGDKYLVLADDTGLYVDALDGPGVHTARYVGKNATDEQNRQKMLKNLEDIEGDGRNAKFKTVISLVGLDKDIIAYGDVPGVITKEELGTKGFGYDCIFLPDGYDETMAQMDLETKNEISHRRNALNDLKQKLEKYLNKN